MATPQSIAVLPTADRLTSGNFHTWQMKMKMLLLRDNLWQYVDPLLSVKEEEPNSLKAQQAWSAIGLSISDEEIVHIRDTTTGRDAWKALIKAHQVAGLSARVFLWRQLFAAKFVSGTVESHINHIRNLASQLQSAGAKIEQEEVASIIISSLPESWDSLIVALESKAMSDLTIEYVSSRLIHEERRRNLAVSSPQPSLPLALAAVRSKMKCSHCRRTGHTVEKCWNLHGRPGETKSEPENGNALVTSNNIVLNDSDAIEF
jgi:gag-polypeptide of LTR copia-type